MRNSHQEIITLNPQYSNAVFFGAGVSFNSGIPTVPGIIDNIFNRFSLPQDELKIFNDSGMPFEAFMDILANGSDIDKLIDIITIGSPNQFHFLMVTV